MEHRVFRCYVEKKAGFDSEALGLLRDSRNFLNIKISNIRLFNRYDVQGIDEVGWSAIQNTVLSEPMSDVITLETLPPLDGDVRLLAVEALPGQFDQRADSCSQCIQMLLGGARPLTRAAKVYALEGIDDSGFEKLKAYIINPVENHEAQLDKPLTLERDFTPPSPVPILQGFISVSPDELSALQTHYGLAMDLDDLLYLQRYFISEKRDPTLTELRVIDTYWSDHCRHTTFLTQIDNADISDPRVKDAYELYLSLKKSDKPVTFMDIATCAMKALRDSGKLPDLDESEEINACTVKVKAELDGHSEDWLLLFKNETHNHPTEIEPFGGAATCIGGAIRDPLSGRSYVYQAMRVTGSGDPRAPMSETLPGKLPQRKLTTTAAAGYSSYGNQIGLSTGLVTELYHPGYIAKRMEIGAVVGAAPQSNVVRQNPQPGDVVLLLGGRTGRDGIGGATGSSKTHDAKSVETCSAEVQKGNAPEERKLQRFFRNPEITRKIKRCNDFGAGGVAVAIGELADGLRIVLDRVPKKYEGLDGTELAISESQERMAVVVDATDATFMIIEAEKENIEASIVAWVTAEPRLIMEFCRQTVVDLDRAFLNSNGAEKHASVTVPPVKLTQPESNGLSLAERLLLLASDINFCSQKGLVERFDGSIGSGSVLMPHGGSFSLTPAQIMAALLPVTGTKTASVMSFSFDPYLSQNDPFGGAVSAVVTSVSKLVASGVDFKKAYLTLQEYFPRPKQDPVRWGLPFAALLGAFSAQMNLGVAAIGGKDSMSGSFNELDVPPTLVSFSIGVQSADNILSPEFKHAGNRVYLWKAPVQADGQPDYPALKQMWEDIHKLCLDGKIVSAWASEKGGAWGGIIKMCLGNMLGFDSDLEDDLFTLPAGSIIAETSEDVAEALFLGTITEKRELRLGKTFCPLTSLRDAFEKPLADVFPPKVCDDTPSAMLSYGKRAGTQAKAPLARPKAVIPVFPGTNCEYDTQAALEEAGAEVDTVLICNLSPRHLEESVKALAEAIDSSQMIVLPGGFSGGDEPDGSGKYIVSFFRHPRITEEVRRLLQQRDGLILGICNGFQALVKLGLLPFGDIVPMTADCPTLAPHTRHISRYVTTRVSSVLSPWLSKCDVGDLHTVPISHGEGRFVASEELLNTLAEQGQIAFQYADGNPNGSAWCIEGISSTDGRILGKMAHSERRGKYVAKNIPGNKWQPLFEGGVAYWR